MNTYRFRRAHLACIPFAVLTLVACGGGGGDEPPAAAPVAAAPVTAPTRVDVPEGTRTVAPSGGSDIKPSNYASLGRSLGGAAAQSMSNPLVAGNVVSSPARETGAALATPSSSSTLPAWVGMAAAKMSADSDRARPAAVESDTVACAIAGTMSVSVNDADDNKKLSAGDSVKLVANACVNEAGAPATNGSFDLNINAIELNAAGEATAIDASGRFVDLRSGDATRFDGAFRIWAKADTAGNVALRLSLRDMMIAQNANTIVFNIDLRVAKNRNAAAMAIDGGISVNDQTYSLQQVQPFTIGANGVPTSGALRMTDAQGDSVLMRANATGRVDYDYIPAGSSVPADTTSDPGWSPTPAPSPTPVPTPKR